MFKYRLLSARFKSERHFLSYIEKKSSHGSAKPEYDKLYFKHIKSRWRKITMDTNCLIKRISKELFTLCISDLFSSYNFDESDEKPWNFWSRKFKCYFKHYCQSILAIFNLLKKTIKEN